MWIMDRTKKGISQKQQILMEKNHYPVNQRNVRSEHLLQRQTC